jgi:hypothetical protein
MIVLFALVHTPYAGAALKRRPAILFARWAGQFDLREIVSASTCHGHATGRDLPRRTGLGRVVTD